MPSGPVLSEADKNDLKKKLQELCEHYWTIRGYKKTSIKELCASAGISIGTFYALYPTKEDLFFTTIENIQEQLKRKFLDTCRINPTKEGFGKSMKEMYREYDIKPFLYDINKPDYQSFVTKLSNESMEKIKFDSIGFFRKAVHVANLSLKVNENEAYGIFSALLSTIYAKETLSITCDCFTVFDFIVDNLIPVIFE